MKDFMDAPFKWMRHNPYVVLLIIAIVFGSSIVGCESRTISPLTNKKVDRVQLSKDLVVMATAYNVYTSKAKTAVTLAEAKIAEYESLKGICVADLDAQDEFKMQVLGSLQTIAGIAAPTVSVVTGIPPAYVDTGFGILFGLLGGTVMAIAQGNRSYAKGLEKGKTPA